MIASALILSLTVAAILSILPRNYHFITLKFHKAPKIPAHKKQLYQEYINSPKWRKIRRKRLEKDNFKCQNFHWLPVKKNLQVHHKTYVRLSNEKSKDLITLCERCHTKIHKRK